MDPIRLGCVKYLNTLPLIEGLQACRDVVLSAAVPAKLIGMLERDEADVALASVIDAARSTVEVALLPVGMIGCDGSTMTVRVFSSVPFEELHEVCADTDSHTSVALLQIVMWRRHARRLRVVEFDARERMALGDGAGRLPDAAWPQAMLLIGDKVVTDSPPAVRYPHQMDLGAAWKELTGLPFVYATWMCRADRVEDPRVRLAAALLERQRLHNATRLDWIVDARAGERHWPTDLAREYLGERLRFDLADREREAVELFLSSAASLALAPRTQPRWAEHAVAAAR
jgi:chorismate dehydratase